MGKLRFNPVSVVPPFIQEGGCRCPEPVDGHCFFAVTHAPQGVEQTHIRYAACGRECGREHQPGGAGILIHGAEQFHHLPGQGNNMRTAHLHASGRNDPRCGVKVNFFPCGGPQFPGTDKDIRQNAQGVADSRLALVGVNIPQQAAKGDGVSDGRIVLRLDGRKGLCQSRRRRVAPAYAPSQ